MRSDYASLPVTTSNPLVTPDILVDVISSLTGPKRPIAWSNEVKDELDRRGIDYGEKSGWSLKTAETQELRSRQPRLVKFKMFKPREMVGLALVARLTDAMDLAEKNGWERVGWSKKASL